MATIRRINGASVRALRKALGKRQDAAAVDAGISAAYLANIEAGRKQPPLEVSRRIADSLAVDLEAITYVLPAERVDNWEPMAA